MSDDDKPAAPVKIRPPQAGGSYLQQPDGTLVKAGGTAPAGTVTAAAKPTRKAKDKSND
jgi:hypothetical protein